MESRIFGFKHKYSQEFLDWLEKELGIKWIKCPPKTIPTDKVEIKPLSPPSNKVHYIDIEYGS